jgi:hypothetical protein
MKMLAFVFSATLFAVVLAQEASALRGAGIRAGAVGVRGVSVGAYRGGLRARNVGYRAAALGGRRYWRRGYGYGIGLGALAGGYYPYYGYSSYASPYYGYSYSAYPAYRYRSAYSGGYGYSSGMATSDSSGAATAKVAATGPGMCGTYLYWKDGKCNDARSK